MTPREILAMHAMKKQEKKEARAKADTEAEERRLRAWAKRIPYFMPDDPDYVDAKRKAFLQHRDEMLAFQKEMGELGDREAAKFFKQEANEAMKEYRGACLILGHLLSNPPGDSPFRRTDEWPLEIIPYAARV